MSNYQTTVRFWAYANAEWRYIVLSEDEPTREYSHSSNHEEGWSSSYDVFTLEDGIVTYDRSTDGTDCDGRSSWGQTLVCAADKLQSITPNEYQAENLPAGTLLPAWEEESQAQRDYSAEAAGY